MCERLVAAALRAKDRRAKPAWEAACPNNPVRYPDFLA
jgi:hypothetical protein